MIIDFSKSYFIFFNKFTLVRCFTENNGKKILKKRFFIKVILWGMVELKPNSFLDDLIKLDINKLEFNSLVFTKKLKALGLNS